MYQSFPRWLKCKYVWLAIAACFSLFYVHLSGIELVGMQPLALLFDKAALTRYLGTLNCWAAFGFIGIYAIATVCGIPGTLLTVAGGAVFGLLWGTLWSAIGATLGAIGAFLVARYLCYPWVRRTFRRHPALARFHQAVKQKPFLFVLSIRFAPISPFNLANFLFGLVPIDLKSYSIGTLLGIIPGTLAYTWLGVTGQQALQGGDFWPFLLALTLLSLLSLMPLVAKQHLAAK